MSKLRQGEGGSEPSLSVQTFCVHTCLMGRGSVEFWTMSKIWQFFVFFMAPLIKKRVNTEVIFVFSLNEIVCKNYILVQPISCLFTYWRKSRGFSQDIHKCNSDKILELINRIRIKFNRLHKSYQVTFRWKEMLLLIKTHN